MSTRRLRTAPVVVVAMMAVACGGDTSTRPTESPTPATKGAETAEPNHDMATDDPAGTDMTGDFGEPAEASEADRTIEVTVDNSFAFTPAEFDVVPGEVVTFQVTNIGDLEHEFVLGDEAAQRQMEVAMAEGDGHAHLGAMSNAVTIHPGEDAELTWRFPDEAMTVLVGCHVADHWEAGMRGSVTVA